MRVLLFRQVRDRLVEACRRLDVRIHYGASVEALRSAHVPPTASSNIRSDGSSSGGSNGSGISSYGSGSSRLTSSAVDRQKASLRPAGNRGSHADGSRSAGTARDLLSASHSTGSRSHAARDASGGAAPRWVCGLRDGSEVRVRGKPATPISVRPRALPLIVSHHDKRCESAGTTISA